VPITAPDVIHRILVTGAFAALLNAVVRSDALDRVELATSYEGTWLAFGGLFAVAGFAEGRWWVLLLTPLAWLIFLPLTDAEGLEYALIFGVPSAFIGLGLGVAARRVAAHLRRRSVEGP
jgi:hypothetical protein